jgi:hypothetical protein
MTRAVCEGKVESEVEIVQKKEAAAAGARVGKAVLKVRNDI